ncbi:MAG: response regulator [Chthoniobacterales bacterium]
MKPPRVFFSALEKLTGRRAVADLRAANQELESALSESRLTQKEVIQQIVSGIVHDFSNALTPILGFSELLLNNEPLLRDSAQTRHFIEMVHSSAQDNAALLARLCESYGPLLPNIEFVALAQPVTSATAEMPATKKPNALSILVVDDDERVCEVVAEYLVSDGHEVTTATSGEEALSQARSETFDVVFLDRAMPGMSGDETAEQIKQLRPELPVIMLTGFGPLIEVTGSRPRAIDAVLSKPVTRAILRQTLAKFSQAA